MRTLKSLREKPPVPVREKAATGVLLKVGSVSAYESLRIDYGDSCSQIVNVDRSAGIVCCAINGKLIFGNGLAESVQFLQRVAEVTMRRWSFRINLYGASQRFFG